MASETPLWKAHDISQALQDKLEELPRVDRGASSSLFASDQADSRCSIRPRRPRDFSQARSSFLPVFRVVLADKRRFRRNIASSNRRHIGLYPSPHILVLTTLQHHHISPVILALRTQAGSREHFAASGGQGDVRISGPRSCCYSSPVALSRHSCATGLSAEQNGPERFEGKQERREYRLGCGDPCCGECIRAGFEARTASVRAQLCRRY